MKKTALLLVAMAFCLGALAFPSWAAVGNMTVLHRFMGGVADGGSPGCQTMLLNGSTFYGVTSWGGVENSGVLFSMATDGSGFQVLHTFTSAVGYGPSSSPILLGGRLYGSALAGGPGVAGILYSVNTDGSDFQVLHNFVGGASDGKNPYGPLITSGTKIFGMTLAGGDSNLGTVFSIDPDGTDFFLIHEFMGGADGRMPNGNGLALSGTTLYGLMAYGGAFNGGVLFSVETDGTGYQVLHAFNAGAGEGTSSNGHPILVGSSIYGISQDKVWAMDLDGSNYRTLHSFAGPPADARTSYGSMTIQDSVIYGATYGGGTNDQGAVFSMRLDGSDYQVLHSFANNAHPVFGGPVIDGASLYLLARDYNENGAMGGAFKLEIASAVPPPVTWDFEDGTTGNWDISSHPNLTVFRNVVDAEQNGKVIELKANTLDTWFSMAGPGGADLGETNTVLQWSLKSEKFFYFYVEVDTPLGTRWLYYTPVGENGLLQGAYAHHSLAYAAVYNQWCTYVRDLAADLDEAEPGNTITAVNRFFVRGTNMRLDDLSLLGAIPADFDSDGDGLFDVEERDTYGTGLYDADSDDDGVNDGPEATLWGGAWNANLDGDGDVNLLDLDSDNDGFDDGTEIAAGSDPGDANSIPPVSYSWDDGGTSGWSVTSGMGVIRNVADNGGRAIELRGTSSTTFSLKNADGTLWHDNVNDTLTWDMKASAMYYLMVDLQTANGHRYLLYTPSETDLGVSGEYLRFGLGVVSKNGTWQSHNRNLAADVSAAEPGNTILEVNQILYKGPGFFDNVRLTGGGPT